MVARLLDHFAPVISAGLRIGERLQQSGEHLDAASAVRESLRDGISTAQTDALNDMRPQEDVALATFAVVTWLDEVMLPYPDWGKGVENLQGELLNTQIAREIFFTKLEALTPNQEEVREIYYLILCLGFQGFYGELESGREELDRLKELHERQLASPPLSPGRLVDEKLTPQPYSVAAPPPPPKPVAPPPPAQPRRGGYGKLIGAAAALAVVLVLVGGFFLLQRSAAARVEQLVAEIECAAIQAHTGFDLVVQIDGHVGSFIDQQELIEAISATRGVRRVDGSLEVEPWPFCELLIDAKPLKVVNDTQGLGANVQLANGAHNLTNGDLVVIDAEAPVFDGFTYVFYVRGDGGVVHLMPNTILTSNRSLSGDRFRIGDDASGFNLRVSEPFGREMLLVIGTSVPLIMGELRNSSDFSTFIRTLRTGLAEIQQSGGQIAANYFFLETQP